VSLLGSRARGLRGSGFGARFDRGLTDSTARGSGFPSDNALAACKLTSPPRPTPHPTTTTPPGSNDLENDNFEFVAPTKVYVVNKGQITVLDLMQLPSLTPRQIQLLARDSGVKNAPTGISNAATPTALMSLPAEYLARRICSSTQLPSEEQFVLQHKPM
jgi:hypothetical protein